MKKFFTLTMLLLCAVVGAKAASVTDLKAISANFTFIADDITSNGTTKLASNTLYLDGYIFAPTPNSVATNKGTCVINGVSHLNSLRLKNTQDQLAFKVSGSCEVTFYTQSHSSRGIKVGSTAGGTEFGSQDLSTSSWTVQITKGGTVYLSSFGGDFYFAGFKVVFPKPEINTQPISATYQKNETPVELTVSATASAGELAYQWYSCDDANKTNASPIDGETNASFTPSTATANTSYYFCRVYDGNGSTDSNVATITVSEATAPTISVSVSSNEIVQFETISLTATATGVPAPTIQWYSCDDVDKSNAVAIDGATNTTYSPSSETIGTFYYYAVATNSIATTASNVVSITVIEDIIGQTFYSWNQGIETGGTAVASDGESVGYSNSVYTTIRLNGKADFSDKIVTITLDKALKSGDIVKVTAYRNKNDKDKQAGFKAKFENGSSTIGSSTGLEFVNIDTSEQSAEDSNRGTEPNTCTFIVPNSAAGSKTITMTRSHTATNLFVTKIEIYRPAICLDAILNAAGMLTEGEVADQTNFSFGVTSNNTRVAADAPNAVTVISGKYYNDHGCTGVNVVAKVPGKVKITIGQCTFSTSEITIKNSSNAIIAALTPNNPACWKNNPSNINEFYYSGEATTLTISGMTYCPYVRIQEVDDVPAISGTITASGYNTYSSIYALDLSTITGGTAYVASSVTDGKVVLTKSTGKVPAGTGLMIAGSAGAEFSIAPANTETTSPTNLLVGLPAGGEVAVADEGYNYVFGWTNILNPGFYKVTSDKPTLAAGKAYLHTNSALGSSSEARLSMIFDDEISGINTIDNSQLKSGDVLYNLSGQRVKNAKNGLYIKGGKKVIIK